MKEKLIDISTLAKKIGLIDKKNGKPLTHTLRFWETKFYQIKPTILSGNRRYYSKRDIEIIHLINFLLKEQGLTIKGAKKILKNDINSLDDFKTSSIKARYFRDKVREKSKKILEKIKNLNGKINTHKS